MTNTRRLAARAGVLVVAVAMLAASSASSAAAATPCWRQILDDWSDGSIEKRYTTLCYEAALRNLPDDVRTYSSAEEDIRRELLEAIRARPSAADRTSAGVLQATRALQSRVPSAAGEPSAVATTADATTPPLRLLIAAAVATLLLAAGGVGKYWTRRSGPGFGLRRLR